MIKLIAKLTGMTLTWDYSDELAIRVSYFTLVKTLFCAQKFSVKLGHFSAGSRSNIDFS